MYKNIFLKLGELASNYDHSKFINEVRDYFNWIYPKEEMDYIGFKLNIIYKGRKGSRPMYLHGYIISSALQKYINTNKVQDITIFETGTARGFSSLIMAHILQNNSISGKIYTIDFKDHFSQNYSNCFLASQLNRKVSRHECLHEWSSLSDKYIKFLSGDSNKIIDNMKLERIHFAFLDGSHEYKSIVKELKFVSKRQLSGDVIICDDYTITQFPEICKAIDEFLSIGEYKSKIFYGNDGTKERGYVYMVKL